MRAIVTVIGKDRVGIIADVTALLAQYGVNVLDISQTVLQEYFTMIMLVDASQCTVPLQTSPARSTRPARSAICRSAPSGRTSSMPCTASEGAQP